MKKNSWRDRFPTRMIASIFETENLVLRGIKTIVVEMLDQVMAPVDYEMGAILHAHLREKGVDCILENAVTEFDQTGDRITVHLKKGSPVTCDMVVLSVGIRPENQPHDTIHSGWVRGVRPGVARSDDTQ